MLTEMSEPFSNDAGLGRLHELINDHPDFELLPAPSVNVYSFRYVPNDLADRQDEPEVQRLLDQLNQEIVETVRRHGVELLSTIRVRDCVAMRLSVDSARASEGRIDAAFEALARWGRLITKTHSISYSTETRKETSLCQSESYSSPMELLAT
jgi:glutamate/tyrosine decarboxylase-like PLP-dependent enzyme